METGINPHIFRKHQRGLTRGLFCWPKNSPAKTYASLPGERRQRYVHRAATKNSTKIKKNSRENSRKKIACSGSDRGQRSHPLQPPCSNSAAFSAVKKLGTPPRTAGHKITTILFFYSDTIHYICNNQLKTYERTTSNYRVPNLRII